jgi:hypothetical protein
MKHAVSDSINPVRCFRDKRESGIAMFRDDKSPVWDVLEYIHTNFLEIAFSVCAAARPSSSSARGIRSRSLKGRRSFRLAFVRIVELQESGWFCVQSQLAAARIFFLW